MLLRISRPKPCLPPTPSVLVGNLPLEYGYLDFLVLSRGPALGQGLPIYPKIVGGYRATAFSLVLGTSGPRSDLVF